MRSFFLTILHHDGAEELRDLPVGEWEIGRQPGCWLSPLDPSLSRRHALLRVDKDTVTVEALPSRNGSKLNGQTFEGTRAVAPGDEVLVGRTLLRLGSGSAELERRRGQRTVELREHGPGRLIAGSEAMRRVVAEAGKLARTPLTILITGETGAGKEVLARHIHATSPRAAGPFVVVNCPALPPGLVESELFGVEPGVATGVTAREGLLEKASHGTLFLDEVGDLPLDVAPKLLRFLQERSIQRVGGRREIPLDVRIVSATHRDLRREAERGAFRSDLFFRLSGASLAVPPLRERREDVLPIAESVLAAVAPPRRLSERARAALLAYGFPGNVRELVAIVERAGHLAEAEEIGEGDLSLPPIAGQPDGTRDDPVAEAEALLGAITVGSADFWADVYERFRRRELPRAVVQEVFRLGGERGGGGIPALARLLGVEDRSRKLLDFVRNNGFAVPGSRRGG